MATRPGSRHYAAAFADLYLAADEEILDFGLALWQEKAERLGRGFGEGALIVTSRRLVHWTDGESTPDLQVPIESLVDHQVRRHLFPNLRVLHGVAMDDDSTLVKFSLATSRPLAKRLDAMLVSRAVGRIAP